MKITEIETLPVSVGGGYDFAVIIVLVRTDEGLTGIGEASLAGHGRGVLGMLDHFSELLVGQDPARIEHWWSEMVRGTFWSNGQVIMSAVAGIDIALWDLKGKALGVPVYELLGGPTRDRVRVYVHLAGDAPRSWSRTRCAGARRGSRRCASACSARRSPTGTRRRDRRDDRGDGGAARRARRRRRPAPRRAHDVLPRRGRLPRPRARAVPALLLRGPDPAAQPARRSGSCATRSTCRSRPASSSRTSGSSSR